MATLLRIASATAALLVVVGFFAFAADQTGDASKKQIAKVEDAMEATSPSDDQEALREREHGPVREFVDDANDLLLAPFSNLIDSKDDWVQRLVPGVLALLIYGFGGALLANSLPQPKRENRDWRTAS